jgi:hypothetical protein
MQTPEPQGSPHTFTIFVDGEPLSTSEKVLTPTQIIALAKLDPSTRYLIEIEGKHEVSYKDKPDQPIHIHEKQRFVTRFCGPMQVS